MTLCVSCRRALITTLRGASTRVPLIRTVATIPASPNTAPANPPPPTAQQTTPVTSSAKPTGSQPYSTPEISPQNTLKAAGADLKKPAGTVKLRGSIPGGTELKGLNYVKGAPPLLAKEDDEYPEWLWTLLTPKSSAMDGQLAKGDLAEMTKKQRAKYFKQQEKLRKSMPKQIPLHEQSIDLTPADASATESLQKRQDLTRSQRDARRKGIRESNFLKTM